MIDTRALKERKKESKSILIYESSLWLKEKKNGSNNVI